MYHPFRRTSHFESRTEKDPKPLDYSSSSKSANNNISPVIDTENAMPNVAHELAALRAKGSVRNLSTNLSAKSGSALSTPEAEAAARKAKRENEKAGNIKAKEILAKGSNAAAQVTAARDGKVSAQKKQDWERKAQATEMMKTGGSKGAISQEMEHSMNQTGKKKAEWEKRNATKREMAITGVSAPKSSPKAAAPQSPVAPPASSEPTVPKTEASASVAKEEPVVIETADDDDVPKTEASASVVKEEPVVVETADDDDDVPDLEEADHSILTQQKEQPEGVSPEESESERQITNRNEKKARKMMTRLGMRPVPGIARVTLKAGPGRGYFSIDRPDVFISAGGKAETYVIFGEARQGGQGGFGNGGGAAGGGDAAQAARAQAAVAQQRAAMAAVAANAADSEGMPSVEEEEDVPEPAVEESAGEEEGVEAKDVDLVMSQASCSRVKAVAALKENDGDLVNAIMSLTT
mmetsp:Transcript_7039/g.13115  ORF Transcript_7039/g.13115 Transcript_7039/m.13115 type:complete len:466 (+) Transcript_7039:57-1454(+)